jgi:hypothetical protein
VTGKPEALACARRLLVIPVNRVVDKKRIIGKNGGLRRGRGGRSR